MAPRLPFSPAREVSKVVRVRRHSNGGGSGLRQAGRCSTPHSSARVRASACVFLVPRRRPWASHCAAVHEERAPRHNRTLITLDIRYFGVVRVFFLQKSMSWLFLVEHMKHIASKIPGGLVWLLVVLGGRVFLQ